jgi:WD40 repeat protein
MSVAQLVPFLRRRINDFWRSAVVTVRLSVLFAFEIICFTATFSVFKILSLDLNSPDRIFALSKNLRGKSSNLNSSTNDVKWHPKVDNLVCTAAMNGAVVVWLIDNANSTRQDRIFNDHERTVNRVSWHPTEAALVLSGSQDGTMKLFDCRGKGCVASFLGKSSTVPVRDVQFSPFYTHNFVSAFDSGVVQLWDSRRASSAVSATTQAASTGPSRSWVAHQGLVLGLDWHPSDRNILATCSRDRAVKVWEMNDMNAVDESPSVGAQQNWRPKATIQTIASVGRIAWRSGGPSRRQQIGSAAALMDTKLQIWDIHRPFVPHASCLGHKDVVTSFMWCRDGDAVITGGKDGRVLLHHVSNAYHPLQHLRTCALAIDVRGQVALSFDPINRVNVDNMSPFVTNATAPASASAATMPAVPPALSDVMSTLIAEFTGAERRVPKSSPAKQLASPAKVAPAAPAPHSAHAGSAALMSAEPPAACVSLAESRPIPVRHASKPAWQWPEEELFVHFARHLQFEGAALRDICEHNASVPVFGLLHNAIFQQVVEHELLPLSLRCANKRIASIWRRCGACCANSISRPRAM